MDAYKKQRLTDLSERERREVLAAAELAELHKKQADNEVKKAQIFGKAQKVLQAQKQKEREFRQQIHN